MHYGVRLTYACCSNLVYAFKIKNNYTSPSMLQVDLD